MGQKEKWQSNHESNETQSLSQAAENLFLRMEQHKVDQAVIVVVPGHHANHEEEYQIIFSTLKRH